MRKLLLILALLVGAGPVLAGQDTLDALSSGSPVGRTDIIPLCTSGASCGTLKKATFANLNTYLNAEQVNCTNASGDIALIQTAVATGKPVHIIGTCKEDTGDTVITLSTPGQLIYGDGKAVTTITVNTVMTTGLFNCTTGTGSNVVGPMIRDIGVKFAQANTSSRASLTNFTPAFRFRDCAGARIEHTACAQGMICYDLRDNSGQAIVDDADVSCLSVCVWMNGALDTIILRNIHVWPFGASLVAGTGCGSYSGATNLCAIYTSLNTSCVVRTTSGTEGPIGILNEKGGSGGEDLTMDNVFTLIGQGVCLGTVDVVNATITSGKFDTFGGLYAAAGKVRWNSGYCGTIQNSASCVTVTGADVTVSGVTMYKNSVNPAAFINAGSLVIDGSNFELNSGGYAVDAETAGRLTFTNNMIINGGGANPMICVGCAANGAVAVIANNQPKAAAGSAATFIKVNADGQHRVTGNGSDTNWANVCPATQTTMRSANNGTAANATCN